MDLSTAANMAQIVGTVPVVIAFVRWSMGKTTNATKSPKRNSTTAKPSVPWIIWVAAAALTVSALISAASLAEKVGWFPTKKPEQVYSKAFKNEDVVLDDHEYYDCTFENTNLIYAGGYFRFVHPKFIGAQKLAAASKSTASTMNLLQMLGVLEGRMVYLNSSPLP